MHVKLLPYTCFCVTHVYTCSFAILCWEIITRRHPSQHFTEEVDWYSTEDWNSGNANVVKLCRKDNPSRPNLDLIRGQNYDSNQNSQFEEKMREIITACWSSTPSKRWNYIKISEKLEGLEQFCPDTQDDEKRNFESQLQRLSEILQLKNE